MLKPYAYCFELADDLTVNWFVLRFQLELASVVYGVHGF